jgi:hypothetical protein
VGAVKRLEDGRICLLSRTYIPTHSDADKLHILGTDVALLISTIDHNLNPGQIGPFYQRKVAYDNLPDEVLPEFRKHAAKKAQLYLENLDLWLSKHDRDDTPLVKGSGRNQAGIGIYYFEKPYSTEDK